MSIIKQKFLTEEELHSWVESNTKQFFGDAIYLTGNFMIRTKRDKAAKPDGFVLDLIDHSWGIVESELIDHGVWDHITEQIVRFIVASKSDGTKRKIRNYFFDELERKNLIQSTAVSLNVTPERLIQQIETIVETKSPYIA